MTRLEWNTGARPYYDGVDRGVLYLPGKPGIAWNGLVTVAETPEGSDVKTIYYEGQAVGVIVSNTNYEATIAAYTYPDEFLPFTGYDDFYDKQPKQSFGFSYRTGDEKTGQIHLVYNATAKPTADSWKTSSSAISTSLFTWDLVTRASHITGFAPTSHLVVDLATTSADAVQALYDTLYGTATTDPKIPNIADMSLIFEDAAFFQVTDNGDGTWTANGSDSRIVFIDADTVEISGPTVVQLDPDIYQISTEF